MAKRMFISIICELEEVALNVSFVCVIHMPFLSPVCQLHKKKMQLESWQVLTGRKSWGHGCVSYSSTISASFSNTPYTFFQLLEDQVWPHESHGVPRWNQASWHSQPSLVAGHTCCLTVKAFHWKIVWGSQMFFLYLLLGWTRLTKTTGVQ